VLLPLRHRKSRAAPAAHNESSHLKITQFGVFSAEEKNSTVTTSVHITELRNRDLLERLLPQTDSLEVALWNFRASLRHCQALGRVL
jgi:hypothetical protein